MSKAVNNEQLASKGSIAFDLLAVGTWGAWVLAYINEHPGESLMWALGLLLMLMRLPVAWIDLCERWRRWKRRRE